MHVVSLRGSPIICYLNVTHTLSFPEFLIFLRALTAQGEASVISHRHSMLSESECKVMVLRSN